MQSCKGSTKCSAVRTVTPTSPAAASLSSSTVTTLFFLLLRLRLRLWRGLLGLGGTPRGAVVLRVTLAVIRLVLLHHPGHVHHQIARGQIHDLHTLGVATRDADAFHRHPDPYPLLRHHHQLLVGQD